MAKIKLLDGAMGTNLIAAGMPKGTCTEKWILENSDVVKNLQSEYINGGSDIIYAPTFGANSAVLAREGDLDVSINGKLVALTKGLADGKNVLVAGDISSTGLMLKPYGSASFEDVVSVFAEQAAELEKAGVDMFVIETSISLKEATAAYYGVRSVSRKPVFVTFTVENGSRTLSGESAEACAVALGAKGACGVGVNCSDGGKNVLESVKRIAAYSDVEFIIAKPNAGLPTVEGDKITYSQSPEEFALFCKQLAAAGATHIGGCCGTTPKHIAALGKDLPDVGERAKKNGIFATDSRDVFEVTDNMELPEKVVCDDFLLFNLPEPEEASCFRIYVDEDSFSVFDETPLTGLPLVIDGSSYGAVEKALRVYSGRAILDRETNLSREEKQKLRENYGVIIFD